jgi:hypothetical protein
MDVTEDLTAIYAAAEAIQASAAKAVVELTQLVADNREIPSQIAQQANRTAQDIPQTVRKAADQALQRIEQGAEAAIRKAAVSDLGAKVEAAIAGPMATLQGALRRLEQTAGQAETAASRWKLLTRSFRWQQLAVAVLAGVVIGSAGTWYFVSQPLKEAADYVLVLKQAQEQRAAAPSQAPPRGISKPRIVPQQRQPPGSQKPEIATPAGSDAQ